ncbi:MAG: hypothetical protein ABEI57_03720 [Halapricum sp.]
MNQLGEENRIPVFNVPEGDIGVLFGFPVVGLFVASVIDANLLLLPLTLLGLLLGTATVYAAPAQLTAWQWLRDVGRFYLQRPRITHSHPPESEHDPTEGGFVQYTPFTPAERTQELTHVERAWPGAGAVQRTDGTMEAFLEIEPANMDFAMSGDWQAVQEAGAEFANAELSFPLTFHATTRSFPVGQVVEQLDDRLSDPDVRANPAFEDLLEEYRERRPADLTDTQQLHYYLGVEVDRLEVFNRYEQERTPGEKLAEIPLVGLLFQPFVARQHDLDEAEVQAAMFEKLDERVRTVRSDFVENVSGWSATRLSTLELFLLNTEFWNGEEVDAETVDGLLREEPVVGREARADPTGGDDDA